MFVLTINVSGIPQNEKVYNFSNAENIEIKLIKELSQILNQLYTILISNSNRTPVHSKSAIALNNSSNINMIFIRKPIIHLIFFNFLYFGIPTFTINGEICTR